MTRPNDAEIEAAGLIPYRAPHHRGGFGLDRLAISASTLCLFHCLALPVLIGFLPSIAQWANLGEAFHIIMLAIAVPLSSLALVRGWRMHRVILPVLAGAAGLTLLMLGVALEGTPLATAITVAGGIVLAFAHIVNLRVTALHALTAL